MYPSGGGEVWVAVGMHVLREDLPMLGGLAHACLCVGFQLHTYQDRTSSRTRSHGHMPPAAVIAPRPWPTNHPSIALCDVHCVGLFVRWT